MENMDRLDKLTPIYGDTIGSIPPYVRGGNPGQRIFFNRTEEVAGSNPARSTGRERPETGSVFRYNTANRGP